MSSINATAKSIDQEIDAKAAQDAWYKSKAFKRFIRNPLAILGVSILIFFALLAILAPVITSGQIAERQRGHTCGRDLGIPRGAEGAAMLRNPTTAPFWRAMVVPPGSCLKIPRYSRSPIAAPPSAENIMGTTGGNRGSGYDIFYGVVWGTRTAFYIGVLVMAISLLIGGIIGGLAGFFGGWVDDILMRFTDIVYAFPNLILAMVFVTILGPGLTNALVALSIVGWTGYARIFRGDILRTKNFDFVAGADALGATKWRIFFKHIFPNSIGSLIIIASLDIGAVVLTASTLSFLGLGAEEGFADWGQIVNFARDTMLGSPGKPFIFWYTYVWPSIAIALFVLGWNLLGDAYRDVADTRSQA